MVHVQRNFYDAENLRYGMEEDGERTNFVTNGWSVFTELDAEWKPTKRLVRGYGIVASEECGQVVEESITTEPTAFNRYHFYHQNEHGDIEYITGSNGKVSNAYTYNAFGTIANSSELVKNRYTYNGEQYDQISQQYYLRARNYNPLIGRFTQEDVFRGDGLNLYAYCGNNSVMYVDPSGYDQIPVSEMSYSDIKQELRKVYSDFVEKKNSNVSSTGNGLLNNELDYGRYGSIPKPSGDDLTGHHMPSNDYMKKNFNISKKDSWAMNLEQPNTSGRHRRTFTYGLSSDSRGKQLYDALTPRDALAFDMYDARRILIEDGVYNADAKKALKNYINDYTSQEKVGSSRSKRNKSKTSFKDIFSKDSNYNERSSKCNNS